MEPEEVNGESVGELAIGAGAQDIEETEAPVAERASGHRAEGGEPAAIPETPRPAARAERGHDVAAPPPTSPDDIDIVAGGMGALALDDRVSVTNPAGTNSMRGADHEQQPEDAADARAQVPERGGMLNGLHRDEDNSDPRWRRRKKHVFIVSSAGKPIFTRHGDEDRLNPLFGVMCSLVSFMTQNEDTPRVVLAGNHKIVFLIRGPIYLICISRTMEPTAHLARQLQFVYTQLVSILTRKGLEHVFKRKHGFDLRNLLGTSGEQVLSHLVGAMDGHKLASSLPLHTTMSFVLGAPWCARLPLALRNQVNKALLSVKSQHLIYAVLLVKNQLVQFVRPRKTALWAEDLLLIINLVNSSASFRESEGTWTPLCLPLYSPDANVFAYICYLHKHGAPDVCLVLVASNENEFFALSASKDTLASLLVDAGALAKIQACADKAPFLIDVLQQSPTSLHKDVLHFIFFSTAMNQFVAPGLTPPYSDPKSQQRLIRQYQSLSFWLHRQQRTQRMLVVASESQTMLAWVDRDVELYMALSPFASRATALAACTRILKWIKKEEQALFITPQMW